MSHLLRPNGFDESLCDICGRNPKTHRIHDKEKIVWLHDDGKTLQVPNKALKITRGATQSTGALGTVGVVGGRMAYKGKIGKRTGGGLMLAGGAFALIDGVLGIVDTATSEIPQERCKSCSRTPNSRGCKAFCVAEGGCGGECENNNWKSAKSGKPCCYHICKECFGKLRE